MRRWRCFGALVDPSQVGQDEKLAALRRLDDQCRTLEAAAAGRPQRVPSLVAPCNCRRPAQACPGLGRTNLLRLCRATATPTAPPLWLAPPVAGPRVRKPSLFAARASAASARKG